MLKPQKCHFAFEQLKFLGHAVSADGVRPDKTAAVTGSVRLKSSATFPWLYANCSKMADPLTQLTLEDALLAQITQQETAFAELRQCMQTAPLLAHFVDEADTEFHTDASNIGHETILVQRHGHVAHVIAYSRRTLCGAETNYCTSEKEGLAVDKISALSLRPSL